MAINYPGIIAIVLFYILILVIGIVTARQKGKKKRETARRVSITSHSDELFLADRGLGMFVASFTLAATNVGGAYINGTAETIGRDGLVWTIAPIAYNIGVIVAAIIYAPKVRAARYTTIFDPIQKKYGNRMGGVLFFPEMCGELFWEAAILAALGTTLTIILDIDTSISIIISACVAVVYTFFGGLYSVAYTDIIQLFLIAIGLILALPFAATNPNVDFTRAEDTWQGHLETNQIGVYIDIYILCICGAIPWQVYYQRALACRTVSLARDATLVGIFMSLLLAIPPAVIGVIGSAADWNATDYQGNATLTGAEWSYVLPMVLQYLCPEAVSVIGIGALSAAVMSSADSIVLAVGSVFSRNIYKNIFRPKASEKETVWVLRISIVVVGAIGAIIAITVRSVYGLYILCGDLMMVIQFPQLTCALWVKFANTYGSALGFIVGLVIRVLGGEPLLNIPTVLRFPFYDEELGQLFPFRTFSMILSFITIISVSYLAEFLFVRKKLSLKYDVFKCFNDKHTVSTHANNGDFTEKPNDREFRGQTDILLKEHEGKDTVE